MKNALEGKVALVTGASRGIGKAIAIKLGSMGAQVGVNYNSSGEAAASVVKRIEERGQKAVAIAANVRQPIEIAKLFDEVIDSFGRLDVVVNNAGMLLNKPIMDVTEEEYDDIMEVNLKSVFFCCQQAARKMEDNGRIVNITSTVTRLLLPTYGTYAATKGAVDQLTRVLAKELGPRNITVNSLSPGPVDTELFRKGKSEQQIEMMAQMAALGRIGLPADIAGAVSLLVTDEAGWISGQSICANGGMAA